LHQEIAAVLDATFNTLAGDGTGRQGEDDSLVAPQHPFQITLAGTSTLTDATWFGPASDGTSRAAVGAASKSGGDGDYPDAARDLSKADASAAVGAPQESSPTEQENDSLEFVPTMYEASDDPHRLAREVLLSVPHPELPGLAFYRGLFYAYDKNHYRPDAEFISGWLVEKVKEASDRLHLFDLQSQRENARRSALGAGIAVALRRKPVAKVTRGMIADVAQALGSKVRLSGEAEPPFWRNPEDRDAAPLDIMPAVNGLVDLGADPPIVWPHTARFFSTFVLPYSYDPYAAHPESWLRFLRDQWADDQESIDVLHEVMGYLLTPDTRYQKMFLLIGPPRSGRSTIRDVITALIGECNVASTSAIALGNQFGLEPLLGKSVAIMADARISGDSSTATERLLRIVGEDPVEVNRKNRPILSNVRMRTRFILVSNELPNLGDAANAITSRYLILRTNRPIPPEQRDPDLKVKLLAELPGILNLAIEGRKRLNERGRFLQPASADDLFADAEDLSSPIAECAKERFMLREDAVISKSEAFDIWREWAVENGHHIGTSGRAIAP
jgi:putative DNA primase/helicase